MCTRTVVRSLAELRSYLSTVEESSVRKSVFILFTGDKDETTGESWCPDCSSADPVVHNSLDLLTDKSEFITCFVGDRSTWKNPENDFRLDKEFKVTNIPTLIHWKKNKVLKEEQCADESLVQLLFEDE